MQRGNRERIPEAEIVELIEFRGRLADAVHLVDAEHDRLAGLLQHVRNVHVICGHAGAQVGHEDDDIRALNRKLRLTAHLFEHMVVGLGLDTARVHDHEGLAAPFRFCVDAISGDAGRVLHDRKPLPDEFVE